MDCGLECSRGPSEIRNPKIRNGRLVMTWLLDVLAHEQARLEDDDPLGRHRDFLPRLGVAAPSRDALAHLEDAEVAQLDRPPFLQILDQMVKRPLNHPLDI